MGPGRGGGVGDCRRGWLVACGSAVAEGRAAALHSDIRWGKGFYRCRLCVWDVTPRSRLL